MEKLSLDKFQDAKLEKSQLSSIHGGLLPSTCTGGGGGRQSYQTEDGCLWRDFNYDSDSVDSCGNTSYSGWSVSAWGMECP